MDKISIVVCDDVEDVRDYIVSIIKKQTDMIVVGTADSEKSAVRVVGETLPDIVLMDIQMNSEKAGIKATETITQLYSAVKTIMITVHGDDRNILDAYAAGAVDYIVKSMNAEAIADSIRKVYNEEYFIGSIIAQKLHTEFLKLRREKQSMLYVINNLTLLTPSESKILKLLYNGNNRQSISKKENLEMSTIKFHINNILKKLQYKKTSDLVNDLRELKIYDILRTDEDEK